MGQNGLEKRVNLRFPVVLPVDFGKSDYLLSTICSNVSQCGLFVETSKEFKQNDRVCMFISLPNQTDPVKLMGEVVWISSGDKTDIDGNQVNGVGIRFLGSRREGAQLLTGFIGGRAQDHDVLVSTDESLVLV